MVGEVTEFDVAVLAGPHEQGQRLRPGGVQASMRMPGAGHMITLAHHHAVLETAVQQFLRTTITNQQYPPGARMSGVDRRGSRAGR